MKDIKSYVIGFLTCACLFLIMGQTDGKQDVIWAETIYAKDISVVDLDNPEEFVHLTPKAINVGVMDPKTRKHKTMCNMVPDGILVTKGEISASLLITDYPALHLNNKGKRKEIKP